ncbi:MAG: ParB family chromosome partitioning protein, partial [Saprospiraceae bacterium]
MSKSKKKELGKGLRALLTNIENTNSPIEKTELVKELNSSILEIPLANIEVNPFQPRTEFDADELAELAQSIKIHGLIQAITVRS